MNPWEKRLGDLWELMERCHVVYMEPELFRRAVNQFLQTSRTVTFIIQKNKKSIPDFDDWYRTATQDWAKDTVMRWAVDSRNTIEKEGDLDLHSSIELSLFFTYLHENDIRISTGRDELLGVGTKRLVRFARKNLPSTVLDKSAIRVERRWVANTLPTWELLQAFGYIYTTLRRTCVALAKHLGSTLDPSIPDPSVLHVHNDDARQVGYLRLSDMTWNHRRLQRVLRPKNYAPPPDLDDPNMVERFRSAATIDEKRAVIAELAEAFFRHSGSLLPTVYLFDEHLQVIGLVSGQFTCQTDKYIYWRDIADRVTANRVHAVASTGEAWVKPLTGFYSTRMQNQEAIGERMFVDTLDRSGNYGSVDWSITRDSIGHPELERLNDDEKAVPAYLAPIYRAFGLPYPEHFYRAPKPSPYEARMLNQARNLRP